MMKSITERLAVVELAVQPVRACGGYQCGRCWLWYETEREAAQCAAEDRTQYLAGEAQVEVVKAAQGF